MCTCFQAVTPSHTIQLETLHVAPGLLLQVAAVNLALRSQDVALIHGPPGVCQQVMQHSRCRV